MSRQCVLADPGLLRCLTQLASHPGKSRITIFSQKVTPLDIVLVIGIFLEIGAPVVFLTIHLTSIYIPSFKKL